MSQSYEGLHIDSTSTPAAKLVPLPWLTDGNLQGEVVVPLAVFTAIASMLAQVHPGARMPGEPLYIRGYLITPK